jgi:hypothetical protein
MWDMELGRSGQLLLIQSGGPSSDFLHTIFRKPNPPRCSQIWGYDAARDMPGIEETWSLLNSKQLGFYDTAEVYGKGLSEKIIGKQLKERTTLEDRHSVIIATKVRVDYCDLQRAHDIHHVLQCEFGI